MWAGLPPKPSTLGLKNFLTSMCVDAVVLSSNGVCRQNFQLTRNHAFEHDLELFKLDALITIVEALSADHSVEFFAHSGVCFANKVFVCLLI